MVEVPSLLLPAKLSPGLLWDWPTEAQVPQMCGCHGPTFVLAAWHQADPLLDTLFRRWQGAQASREEDAAGRVVCTGAAIPGAASPGPWEWLLGWHTEQQEHMLLYRHSPPAAPTAHMAGASRKLGVAVCPGRC